VFLTEDFIIALAATGIPFSENANQMGTLFKVFISICNSTYSHCRTLITKISILIYISVVN
jgi:hypothetical protein